MSDYLCSLLSDNFGNLVSEYLVSLLSDYFGSLVSAYLGSLGRQMSRFCSFTNKAAYCLTIKTVSIL